MYTAAILVYSDSDRIPKIVGKQDFQPDVPTQPTVNSTDSN